MKIFNNLYHEIYSFSNLEVAYRRARCGNRRDKEAIEFEINLEQELLKLQEELIAESFVPRKPKEFVVRDPKTRLIRAPPFRDRVVHQALCAVLEPILDSTFISDSFASRKGKGTHAAIRRFDKFKRKINRNGRIAGYVLKADIRHYFDSVNHKILMNMVEKKIKDKNVLNLISAILKHGAKAPCKGMPLGNLTSQIFANLYLNDLDQFVKHKLKEKFYIRYMDDFVILHRSKEHLEYIRRLTSEFLSSELKLEMHPQKSKTISLHSGISFLGYRIFYNHKLLKKSNIRIFRRRLKEMIQEYKNNEISLEDIHNRTEAWLAYAEYANTFKLRRKIRNCVQDLPFR